ncbi:unnamed protein product [Calypogeia fissa]
MGWVQVVCGTCNATYCKPSNSTRPTCEVCTTTLLDDCHRNLDEKYGELEVLWSRLQFLRYQFDNGQADGDLKGDAMIVVQGRTEEPLYVHKFIMSSKSSVFCKIFYTKMIEDETGIVRIDDATHQVMRAVIKFCYDGEINFTDEVNAEEVLQVAHKYDIGFLHKVCEDYLITTINDTNLPKTLKLAKKFEAADLEVAASKYFKDHFDRVISNVLAELC